MLWLLRLPCTGSLGRFPSTGLRLGGWWLREVTWLDVDWRCICQGHISTRTRCDSDVRDYVDDVVLQAEGDTPAGVVDRLSAAAREVKRRFADTGQVLNDAKEQVFVPNMETMRSWVRMNPSHSGRIAKSVKDLVVGFSAVGVRSPDRGDRFSKAVEICGRVWSLTLGPKEKQGHHQGCVVERCSLWGGC